MGLNFPKNSTAEASPAKLRQLSDEVNRVAATLASFVVAAGAEPSKGGEARANDRNALNVPIETVRHAIKERQLRAQFFDEELFADPAWDMLLDLFESELAQLRVSVSSLCVAAAVPPTTALRWITKMTDAGLFKRRPDPQDGRRFYVELSPQASDAMRRYFGALGKPEAA